MQEKAVVTGGNTLLPVYFQMCELLQYFCDCELKHRIESIISFSDSFVSKLQFNQKFRYNELMVALNMSAAVTAKKTKEFRSPPQEQVRERNRPMRNGSHLTLSLKVVKVVCFIALEQNSRMNT